MQSLDSHRQSFAGLVDELDDRLPRDELIIDLRDHRPAAPAWVRPLAVCLALVFAVVLLGGPLSDAITNRCEFDHPLCSIEDLDIDAILLAIPDADLFDVLPPINDVDPNDDMTLAQVLHHDSVHDLDPATLIRESEVARVLNHLD